MSWQSYVDDHLVGSGNVTKAAIVGLDGNVWAQSPEFNVRARARLGARSRFSTLASAERADAGGIGGRARQWSTCAWAHVPNARRAAPGA